jgi:hypothetical protein
MKKLFTIFACASLAFTLSAQDSEQAAGSYYLGTGNALDLVDIFVGGVDLTATVGYAVIDDLVVTGAINGATDNLMLDLGVRYFWNGVFFQVVAADAINDGLKGVSIGAGKYFNLGSVSDRFYIDPQINYSLAEDGGFETMIGLGARF